MESRLSFNILPQPDEITCGPTCLQAIYGYYDDTLPLEKVISEVEMLEGGGTLGVWLACHAMRRGYRATIYTFKLQLFDPHLAGARRSQHCRTPQSPNGRQG